ncbi:hypothetical protein JOM56_007031 [Amanita muscaria]
MQSGCHSTRYQQDLHVLTWASKLPKNCTTADQAAAGQLTNALCGGASNTTATGTSAASTSSVPSAFSMSGTVTMSENGSMPSMTVATSKSSSGTGSSSAASSSTSNGANAQADLGFFTLGVAAAGAVVAVVAFFSEAGICDVLALTSEDFFWEG